jgi:fatty acid desaturase
MMPFYRPSTPRALAVIAGDYALILAIIVSSEWVQSLLVYFVAMILIAGRQVALLNLTHAAAHNALFGIKWLNDHLDWLIAYPVLDAVDIYRVSHLEHHRDFRLASPDRFYFLHDELALPRRGPLGRLWVVILRPALGYAGLTFFLDTFGMIRRAPGFAFRLLLYWAAVIAVCVWLGCAYQLLIYWFVPMIWICPILHLWAEIGDHYGAAGVARNFKGWFWSILVKPHETYHCVHHLYPHIPFYCHRAAERHLVMRGVRMETLASLRDFLGIVFSSVPGDRQVRQ